MLVLSLNRAGAFNTLLDPVLDGFVPALFPSLSVKMQVMVLNLQGFCEAIFYVKEKLRKEDYKCQCIILGKH